MNKRSLSFLSLLILLFIYVFCNTAYAAASDDWTFRIYVVPPDAGWDSEDGRSIKATLAWFEKEINQDPNGLIDNDIAFIYMEKPVTLDTVEKDATKIKNSKCIAALNFASDEINRLLVPLLGYGKIPVLLSEGEEVWLKDGTLPYPYVFALQLYRDYRTVALVEYAKKVADLSANHLIAVIGSRFSRFEEREAMICEDLFSLMNWPVVSFWTDSSAFNTYRLIESEIKSTSAGILFCYVGSMATREIWRGVRGLESQFQLWYPGVPNELFTSYNGIVFADQSMKDMEEGVFIGIKRKLWATRAVDVKSEAAAGKAFALVSWLFEAIRKGKRVDADVLIYYLANAENIPFGKETLNISEKTNRPEFRNVYIMRIIDKAYKLVDILKIKGL
ncbi:MAG: hypothetical protein FWF87_02870 [Synergistaceae bacterium]|nr:hypothetical protein [Synergistaceae bacterium]